MRTMEGLEGAKRENEGGKVRLQPVNLRMPALTFPFKQTSPWIPPDVTRHLGEGEPRAKGADNSLFQQHHFLFDCRGISCSQKCSKHC